MISTLHRLSATTLSISLDTANRASTTLCHETVSMSRYVVVVFVLLWLYAWPFTLTFPVVFRVSLQYLPLGSRVANRSGTTHSVAWPQFSRLHWTIDFILRFACLSFLSMQWTRVGLEGVYTNGDSCGSGVVRQTRV